MLQKIGQDPEEYGTDDDLVDASEGYYDTAIQFLRPPFNTINLAITLSHLEGYCRRRPDQLILVVDYIQLFEA